MNIIPGDMQMMQSMKCIRGTSVRQQNRHDHPENSVDHVHVNPDTQFVDLDFLTCMSNI